MRSLYVNPTTGGYVRVGNKLQYAPSAVVKANMLLLQPVGSNLYYPNLGNPLLTVQGTLSKNQVVNGINACLAPLISSGDIVNVTIISYTLSSFNKPQVKLEILLPSGEKPELSWDK